MCNKYHWITPHLYSSGNILISIITKLVLVDTNWSSRWYRYIVKARRYANVNGRSRSMRTRFSVLSCRLHVLMNTYDVQRRNPGRCWFGYKLSTLILSALLSLIRSFRHRREAIDTYDYIVCMFISVRCTLLRRAPDYACQKPARES